MSSKPHALYRHYDKSGTLLYIGISNSVFTRLSGHKHSSSWIKDAVRMDTEYFKDKPTAEIEEALAIKRERPKFNIKHNNPSLKSVTANKKIVKKEISEWRYSSFCDLTDNEKKIFIACATVANRIDGKVSLDGRVTISASYFSELFDVEIDDAYDCLVAASSIMMKREVLTDCGSIARMIGSRTTYKSAKAIRIGFHGDMLHVTDGFSNDDDFNLILKSLENHDKAGCKIEYWCDYFKRLREEKEAWKLAYLEKHNCVGQELDAVYVCKGSNGLCEMNNFMAPSSLKNNPPPCEDCGGITEFECMYE